MIARELSDAGLVNDLTNHPDILPYIVRHGKPVDWSPHLQDLTVLTNGKDAAMIFEQTAERDWQVTTIYGPTCRGRRALETGLAMKEWMRPHADLVFGSIPNAFRHAQWFYRKMGGRFVDQLESGGYVYTAQDGETLLKMEYS